MSGQPFKSEAIKKLLTVKTHSDLSNLYSLDMECQVNVAQGDGERIAGEYKGKKWQGWTDGFTTWKAFRIPFNANSDAHYEDTRLKFDLAQHAEGIGMTGWDWKNRVSKWVAFDFDSIINHKEGLTHEELQKIKDEACDLEWVTVRRSTSGTGYHLYVFLDNVPTDNHHEHAALARSILGTMSALTGYDFESTIDCCGGNMWVWHRKMAGTKGLELVKQGTVLTNIPPNWRDHVKVVTGKRHRALPQDIEDSGNQSLFDELCGKRTVVALDEEHKKLIDYLKDTDAFWWWEQDQNMLVTHTWYLQKAQEDLNLRGAFKTNSGGTNLNEQNCFLFPMRRGAWRVRRYTPGVREHETWNQDGSGWTTCFLNKQADLSTAARAYGGVELPKGGFVFREAEVAENAARLMGADMKLATYARGREVKLYTNREGKLIAELEHNANDLADQMQGWRAENKKWSRVFNVQAKQYGETELETETYKDVVRHIVTSSGENSGWVMKTQDMWITEPLRHIELVLSTYGHTPKEVKQIIGNASGQPWKIVNKPFKPEYPGNREWNRHAAQLRFAPNLSTERRFPTWSKILHHVGKGLDEALKDHKWAKNNGITTGADYLKVWMASLFQEPEQPLPYLFFFGPQNSGKSIVHESIELLLTKGYRRADAALVNQSTFNGELEGAIVCVVEETDLRRNKAAYNRIKDWVNSREINIHHKGKTPYHIKNTTHWIQCSNDHHACPIFTGDTRITMCYVDSIDPADLIPKRRMIQMLEKEAPDFIGELLQLELPESNDRLNVPIVDTGEKVDAAQANMNDLERFIHEKCRPVSGYKIKFSDFYDHFIEWLEPNAVQDWSKIRVGRSIPPQCPKGKARENGQMFVGNIMWASTPDTDIEVKPRYILKEDYLEPVQEEEK